MEVFPGCGEWWAMPLLAKSIASKFVNSGESAGVSDGVGGSFDLIDGDRRCLCMYDAEFDRGGVGRPTAGDRGPFSMPNEELLLRAGLLTFDVAGDCCAGGV